MSKIIGYFMAFLTVICIMVWGLVITLGGTEILWWIFTGDFFHFIGEISSSVW